MTILDISSVSYMRGESRSVVLCQSLRPLFALSRNSLDMRTTFRQGGTCENPEPGLQ